MAPTQSLYLTVWRWHLYAGLFCIPFLLLLSATGAIYLFRVEFEEWRYRGLLHVSAGPSERLPHQAVVASVQRAFPGVHVDSYVPPATSSDSAIVQIGAGHGDHHGADLSKIVFVNPYTGEVLGAQVSDDRFMERVKRLHGRLLAGTPGRVLIELATGWMAVLIVSGLYLWFPRVRWSVWGTLLPRLGSGKHILLRDLHAVAAVYLSLGLGFQILSGQPWTVVSSNAIVAISDATPGGPNSAQASRFHSQPPAAPAGSAQDWLAGLAAPNAEHLHSAASHAAGPRLTLDQVTAIADSQGIVRPYQVAMPEGPTGVYSVRSLSRDPRDTVYLHLDQYSGAVLASIPFAELTVPAQAVVMGIALHEGRVFGRANQLLGLAVAAGSFFIAAVGAMLWWSRRSRRQPATQLDCGIPRGLLWIPVLLGVPFPVAGLSMLLLWSAERLAGRRRNATAGSP